MLPLGLPFIGLYMASEPSAFCTSSLQEPCCPHIVHICPKHLEATKGHRQLSHGSPLTALMAAAQVDDAATNGTEHPPVSEAELKEAWLATCRALYEVQPFLLTCAPALDHKSASQLLASFCRALCMQKTAWSPVIAMAA